MPLPSLSGTLTPIDAMYLAHELHVDQRDFDGAEHFEHLRRVASMAPWDCVKVAWLHDAVEDTDATVEDLRRRGLSVVEADALERLTRCEEETYAAYIGRLIEGRGRGVWIACRVKEADLLDNLSRCLRMSESAKATSLAGRYRRALVRVQGALTGL